MRRLQFWSSRGGEAYAGSNTEKPNNLGVLAPPVRFFLSIRTWPISSHSDRNVSRKGGQAQNCTLDNIGMFDFAHHTPVRGFVIQSWALKESRVAWLQLVHGLPILSR